jgi:hypothetical protein
LDSVNPLLKQTAERGSQRDLVSIIERIVGGRRRNERRFEHYYHNLPAALLPSLGRLF